MPDLSDGVNWSEVDADNNHPAPNGWPEGMMPSGVNDAARADRGALKRFWDKANPVQQVNPSGGLYNFITANPAYPTAYVDGEIYWFHPGGPSVGGDYFQVNFLDPKPIWKRAIPGPSGFAAILAQDIQPTAGVQLIYMAFLNAGTGVFILLNPFVPIYGDGLGGVSTTSNLTVAGGVVVNGGNIRLARTDQPYGYITRPALPAGFNNLGFQCGDGTPLNDVLVSTNTMEVTGRLAAIGYSSRSGVNGPYQSNVFNIQWTGTAAHLWIDTTDVGPLAIASGGDIVVGGDASITGALHVAGNITTPGQVQGQTLRSLGDSFVNGGLTVGTGLTVNGSIGVTGPSELNGTITANAATFSTIGVTGPSELNGEITANVAAFAGQVQANQGLYVTGAYPGDSAGHTIFCNGGLIVNTGGATIFPTPGQQVALTVNAGIDVHPAGGDCMHAFGNVDIDGNLTVGTLNGHPATAIFDQLDALAARVQALEEAR